MPTAAAMLRFALALLIAAPVAAPISAQTPDTLHAALDLRSAIADGWLDPSTATVGLRGSLAPLAWDATFPARDADGDGVYQVAVPFVLDADSVRVEVKIKVDARDAPEDGWQRGPNHAVTVRRGGATLDLPWSVQREPTVTGTVEHIPDIGGGGLAERDVFVYLPPGYADGDRRYPVLYLHDGENAFGTQGGDEWRMDEAAEALIAAGEVEPLIIVGVASTEARMHDYTPTAQVWRHDLTRTAPPTAGGALGALTGAFTTADGDTFAVSLDGADLVAEIPGGGGRQPLQRLGDDRYLIPLAGITVTFERSADGSVSRAVAVKPTSGGGGDAYGAFLTDIVKPMVDARYRTLDGPEHTGLGGVSLGGLITMHLGLTRPDMFGRLIVASPSVWWDGKWLLGEVDRATPAGQRVWVDIGSEESDSMVPDARALAAGLVSAGWPETEVWFVEAGGAGHEWPAWAARAPDMLRFLFPAD